MGNQLNSGRSRQMKSARIPDNLHAGTDATHLRAQLPGVEANGMTWMH
jgi:hypothetical protein